MNKLKASPWAEGADRAAGNSLQRKARQSRLERRVDGAAAGGVHTDVGQPSLAPEAP